jgi:hypothetical protein
MPYGDKTGPDGQGARTGRGLGNCNGQGGAGRGVGRGLGRGGGRGLGRGRGLGSNANQGNSWLGDQLSSLQAAIEKLTEKLGK